MFRRIILTALVLGLALSIAVTPAAAKTETFHFKFQGQFAEAIFSTFDETGCIETFAYVAAQEGKVKVDGRPQMDSFAIVNLIQFNYCTEEFLLDAFGFATLAPDEFIIDKKLNQATLSTTIVVDEFLTGMTFPVNVNVSWTGVGETFTVKDRFKIKEPGFKLNSRFMGTFREAQANGTVTGMGVDFASEPAVFAQMGNVKVGEVAIVKDL